MLETSHFMNLCEHEFLYRQELDLTGFIGRAMSVSYLPREGTAHEQLISSLQDLYQRFCNKQGHVYMVYRTSVHLAEASK